MKRTLLLILATAACSTGASDRYGFVTVLGRDTVAVEQITRTPDKLVSEEVDRWPAVRKRHTELALAPDGSITHMVMDVRTPNALSPKGRGRQVTADITHDSVKVSIRDSAGVKDTAFANGGAITVPHVSMMYSVIELEMAAAMNRGAAAHIVAGDSIPFRQFYPDRDIGESFVLHNGWVHPLPGGKVELWHDWLSGIGDATFDADRHMLTYSGARSTYAVEVKRVSELPNVESAATGWAAAEKAGGGIKQLSVRDSARGKIGAATFLVDYGRPLARGRVLLGNIVAFDDVWRTGANAATQFSTSSAITLAGLPVPAGTYTLWTVPHKDGTVDLIVNKETGQWGTDYDRSHNHGTAPMKAEANRPLVEEFTISIAQTDAKHGSLVMEWGTFRWSAPIALH